jgi:hypothetical protein
VTPNEVLNQLLEVNKKQVGGEISKAQFDEEAMEILERARISMTDDEFLEIQRDILVLHHLLAQNISAHGSHVPGNDPQKPN